LITETMIREQLRRGITLAKAGKSTEARSVLGQVVKEDPRSVQGWLWLASVVETQEQQRSCLEIALRLNPHNEAVRQALAQIQSHTYTNEEDRGKEGKPVSRAPERRTDPDSQYFVSHQGSNRKRNDWRRAVANVFAPLGYEPRHTDRQPQLMDICQDIFLTRFGIFELSSEDLNGYLELGIALGLNRPAIVTTRDKASLPPELEPPHAEESPRREELAGGKGAATLPSIEEEGGRLIVYADHSDLETKLARLRDHGFPPSESLAHDMCYFCDKVCESMSTPPDENAYLVLNHSKLLWRELMGSLAPCLAEYHLYPVYLTDRASGPRLCDVRRKVLSAQFVLCHLGALSNESSYLALGMAIGSRAPRKRGGGSHALPRKRGGGSHALPRKRGGGSHALPREQGEGLHTLPCERGEGLRALPHTSEGDKECNVVPIVLQEIERIEYSAPADLERPLTKALGTFLGRIMAGSSVERDKTALLSLPFWLQLDDWIERATQPAQTPETVRGRIRIVHYKGQRRLLERVVPDRGLLVGRSSDCDVFVENQSVSSHHFRILKGRTGKTFVEDLNSRNSTFLNGTRLPPGKGVEIRPNDTIRIPGARFLVWDDRPLPKEEPGLVVGTTAMLPPIPRIEIPDVSPPTYLSTWDHSLVLTVLLPDGHHRSTVEVQAYYPMGKIMAALVDLLDLPQGEYHFRAEDEIVDQEETPLSAGIKSGDTLAIMPKESLPPSSERSSRVQEKK